MGDPVYGGKWADRDLFALDADVTVYWPDVRPCYDRAADDTTQAGRGQEEEG